MTKIFCDVCGEEMFGWGKFKVAVSYISIRELDVCGSCQEDFNKARKQADIDTFTRILRNK